jgi:hypothetical protein
MVFDIFFKCIVHVSKLIEKEVDMSTNLIFHYSFIQ